MKITIIGPPGSGKGVQCELLANYLEIPHISVGRLLRDTVKKGDPYKIANDLNSGKLVPNHIADKVLNRKISRLKKGYILDGFPRSMEQAISFSKTHHFDTVIYLYTPPSVIIKRLANRRQCEECSHIEIKEKRCTKCGGKLFRRKDDRPSIIKKRLELFRSTMPAIVRYFKSQTDVIKIAGDRSIPTVQKNIIKALDV